MRPAVALLGNRAAAMDDRNASDCHRSAVGLERPMRRFTAGAARRTTGTLSEQSGGSARTLARGARLPEPQRRRHFPPSRAHTAWARRARAPSSSRSRTPGTSSKPTGRALRAGDRGLYAPARRLSHNQRVEVRPYSEEDLAMTEALETDPETMRELGGRCTDGRSGRGSGRRLRKPSLQLSGSAATRLDARYRVSSSGTR